LDFISSSRAFFVYGGLVCPIAIFKTENQKSEESRMKKFKLTYTSKKGNEHQTTVYLEDEIAKSLEEVGDENLLRQYLLMEHNIQCADRVEEYWCHSLESYKEKGVQFAAKEEKDTANFLNDLNDVRLQKAIKHLNTRQKELLKLYYQDRKTIVEIGDLYGVSFQAVSQALDRVQKTILRFY
jgi:RNA polymerase sigma factor (sigma-70 family)